MAAKPGWARRNELARERGYTSYYDYRAHGYGKIAPGEARASGARLRALRGHASYADLMYEIRRGNVEIVSQVPGERDPNTGEYRSVTVDVQLSSGETRTYTLKGQQLRGRSIGDLRAAMSASGTDIYTNPSLDIMGPESDDDFDEEYERGYDDESEAV